MSEYSRHQLDHATAALYATPGTEPKRAPRKKRTVADGPTESQIQKSCVKWFDMQYPELYYNLWAVPNGGARNAITGANLKAEGVRPGVSDIHFYYNHTFCVIEMKKPGGKMSKEQKEYHDQLEQHGAITRCIDNLDDFIKLIREVVG